MPYFSKYSRIIIFLQKCKRQNEILVLILNSSILRTTSKNNFIATYGIAVLLPSFSYPWEGLEKMGVEWVLQYRENREASWRNVVGPEWRRMVEEGMRTRESMEKKKFKKKFASGLKVSSKDALSAHAKSSSFELKLCVNWPWCKSE